MIHLCLTTDLLENQSRGFSVQGQALLAARKQGRVYLYRNRCPHRHVPLNWQADSFLDDSASMLRCAHHGALFLIENGECVAGPCAGKELEQIPCCEDEQGIWADL